MHPRVGHKLLKQRRYMDALIEFGVAFVANCITEQDIEVQREAVAGAHFCVGKVAKRIQQIYAGEVAQHLRHEDPWVRQAALEVKSTHVCNRTILNPKPYRTLFHLEP